MPVSPELEQALPRFVEAVQKSADVQDQLNRVVDLEQLKAIVNDVEPLLTGSASLTIAFNCFKSETRFN